MGCLAELELAAGGVDADEGGRWSKQREAMEGGQKERVGSGEKRRGDGDETRCIYSGLIQPARGPEGRCSHAKQTGPNRRRGKIS